MSDTQNGKEGNAPQTEPTPPRQLQVGNAQIHLCNIDLGDNVVLDEVHLEGGDIRAIVPGANGAPDLTTGEIQVKLIVSETNLNRVLSTHTPPDAPVRNLHIAILTGKLRVTGQFVKIIPIPFTVDATLRIEQGVRISLDLTSVSTGPIGLPSWAVDIVEASLSLTLDLARLPFPVSLDSVHYEPGRVTLRGRVRIELPPVPRTVPPVSAPAIASAEAIPARLEAE